MNAVEALFKLVGTAMLYIATGFLILMTGLVVLASFMRYGVGRPLHFTEELVALLYMGMVFLAVPIATLRHGHVSISVLPARLTNLLRYPFRLAACAAMIIFCVWFAIASYGFVAQSHRFASRSEQADFLLWPWMAIIPLTMGFVAVISFLHLLQAARGDRGALDPDQAPAGDAL